MNAAFDTLTAARELEAAGVGRKEAEAIAVMGRQAAGADRDQLATKADIKDFATKADLYRALLLVVIGQTALIVGLLKLLP